jgi:3-oxoadipate enol-lactonase/3-oxoadipate enol-lactonase/4-carboxymuconolactone decarboxylase
MKPALTALAGSCRTISYSLCGDIGSGHRPDPALGFDNYLRQLDLVLDAAGLQRAALCGISFGGFVALRYAASRPTRVSALVLASAPAPGWKPNARQARWIARPWLSAPVFVLTTPTRVWPEVSASFPRWSARLAFLVRQGIRAGLSPMIPSLMATRVHQAQAIDFAPDCGNIRVPTMIVTGEEGLDRVVPVSSTRMFRTLIPGAVLDTLDRTGHLGCLTQPSRFAETVSRFVHAHSH